MVALDSSFLIDALREREPAAGRLRDLHGSGEELAVTPVVAAEVLMGASPRGGAWLDRAVDLLRSLAVLEFDLPCALAVARIDAQLRDEGRPLATADLLTAGIVLRHGERLLTRDADFARVRGLRVERY